MKHLIFMLALLAAVPAHADPRWRGGGHGEGGGWHGQGGGWQRPWQGPVWHRDDSAAVGGFLGGVLGGYLWRQWAQPPEPVRDEGWCAQRYRSYDPYTRTYLGFDGLRHGCP